MSTEINGIQAPAGKVLKIDSPEQVRDFLKNDEIGQTIFKEVAGINKYIAEPVYIGLETNKNQILKEKKELQENYRTLKEEYENLKVKHGELEKELDTVDKEEYNRLKAEKDKWLENQGKLKDDSVLSNEITTLKSKITTNENIAKKKYEEFEKVIKEKDTAIKELTTAIDNHLISQTLNNQMDQAMINEEDRVVLFDFFRSRASIEVDEFGKKRVVMTDWKDPNIVLPDSDFFTAWTNEDSNKRYIKAPDHTGGGSGTIGGVFGGANLDELKKQHAIARQNGETEIAVGLKNQIYQIERRLNGSN
jgi:hypothetical protein